MVKDIPLARALHAACELGQEIPRRPVRRGRPGARLRDGPAAAAARPAACTAPHAEAMPRARHATAVTHPTPHTRSSTDEPHEPPRRRTCSAKLAVPVGVVGIVLLLVVPLPAAMLDVLIVLNISFALVVLLTSMYVKQPLDFSVFPSLLLVPTLFRLGLNVASTRLVLSDGYAGQVIDAFGHFVVGGSLVIGLVIFLILVVIQFAVITKGAGRVAEVGARFTLDAMPGKQMAIDADLNAGLINDDAARSSAGPRSRPRPTSTARWTVPRSSSRATRSPASSSRRQPARRLRDRHAADAAWPSGDALQHVLPCSPSATASSPRSPRC